MGKKETNWRANEYLCNLGAKILKRTAGSGRIICLGSFLFPFTLRKYCKELLSASGLGGIWREAGIAPDCFWHLPIVAGKPCEDSQVSFYKAGKGRGTAETECTASVKMRNMTSQQHLLVAVSRPYGASWEITQSQVCWWGWSLQCFGRLKIRRRESVVLFEHFHPEPTLMKCSLMTFTERLERNQLSVSLSPSATGDTELFLVWIHNYFTFFYFKWIPKSPTGGPKI